MDAFMQQRRPPPHIRSRVALRFRVTGQSVEIFETGPRWQGQRWTTYFESDLALFGDLTFFVDLAFFLLAFFAGLSLLADSAIRHR